VGNDRHGYTACTRSTVSYGNWGHAPASFLIPSIGPVVRVSPTLVSVSDPEALKVVYGGKLLKSPVRYDGKKPGGYEHALVFYQPAQAKARRGLLLPLFQRANLESMFEEMTRYITQLADQMSKEQKEVGSVDMFRWFRLAAFDIIGLFMFTGGTACAAQ